MSASDLVITVKATALFGFPDLRYEFRYTKAYTVQSNSQLSSADQFRPMIISYRNGNPVRRFSHTTKGA